ncbi:DsbA family protein [Thalassobius sp. S69A]|uniref:DsbA family protein n=1 Tax=unclassified Thalassovita TaxID=2619711 RepID=UPI000C40E51E|nr:thiol-disulfide oxidoreductase [Paracoccaceae bacterium]
MDRRYALGVIGAAAVIGGALTLTKRSDGLPPMAALAEGEGVDTSSVVEMALGAEDAKVTLIEYASYTCPHCATFHNGPLKKIKEEYVETGKVRFIYRDVYFDRPGLWAALVARCDPSKFFGISDLLYGDQKAWVGSGDPAGIVENLRKIGRIAGLTEEQLDTCLSDGTRAQTLYTWFQDNAKADDIDSTPSLILNGKKHSNMSYTDLKTLLDEALEA